MIGQHSRGTLLGLLLLSACSPAGRAASDAPATSPDRPNVLLIVTDDLRCETAGYGSATVRTPNLDRLARRGMRFDRAYAQATLCSPSRVSFLTGLRPDRTGVHDNVTDYRVAKPDVVTLAQLLREHGWVTRRIGKVFHDRKETDDAGEWDEWSYPRSSDVGRRGEGRNLTGGALKWCRWRAAEGGDDDQPDGGIAREAVRFLEQPHEKPFLLALGFHSPHDPFVAPAPWFGPYPLDAIAPLPAPTGPRSASAAHFSGYQRVFDRFSDTDRREFLRAYRAATSFLDAQVGRVLDALERSPFADDTIVVFLSDHGYHLGEHGWWSKATLFEVAARTPLVVSAPGMKARGETCARLVELVDVVPTIAELCGVTPPADLDGRSLVPLLDDPDGPGKGFALTQIGAAGIAGRSVRTDRWRYIEWPGGRGEPELYDHPTDPGELRNVAEDPRYAEVVRELGRVLGDGAPAPPPRGR